jgi:hypothetical protein
MFINLQINLDIFTFGKKVYYIQSYLQVQTMSSVPLLSCNLKNSLANPLREFAMLLKAD